jgi:hypothetical protein
MPSSEPIPTVPDLIETFHAAVRSGRKNTDKRTGALYDICAGAGALLWRRQAERDRDEFARVYFDTARGDDLDERVERKLHVERTLDTYGIGVATVSRSSAALGGGTIPEGTRIGVRGGMAAGVT